ncbi:MULTISPECIES: hypothetical protein [Streptomyces]|uniref:Secreted protein n=2 Tax=Streptomyces TaxID=1883 RepID=A0ABU2RW09_9ACTN|nr:MULTISPECIES: hypothetical protein [unclassified Streptomyces]MBK3596090.1 hypothetical protein [Streptomyces sp. MBT51]MDT0432094.1 hypothetical protein [Streptomyces sp. DSM 41770]HBF84722.1 hypothetical protein [Streptomyces sp.]
MNIDWAALASVFGVSLVVTVALVGLFSLGVVALARQASPAQGAASPVRARAGAYACFALCAAAVAYGIYLIVA